MIGWYVNYEFESIWKEAFVAYFKVLSRHSLEEMRKTPITLSEDSRYPGRNLNPGPPEYQAGVLTTQP
jgi:hypothetical protein